MVFISFATRRLLTPTPDNASKNILGPLNFLEKAEYAIIEKSLLITAFGLKNIFNFDGADLINVSAGISILVLPSTISIISISFVNSYSIHLF